MVHPVLVEMNVKALLLLLDVVLVLVKDHVMGPLVNVRRTSVSVIRTVVPRNVLAMVCIQSSSILRIVAICYVIYFSTANCVCGSSCTCVDECGSADGCCPCTCQGSCDGSTCKCEKDKCFCDKDCCTVKT